MTVITSALDTHGADYRAHREAMLGKLAGLDAEHAKALAGGGEKYVARHRARGKLLGQRGAVEERVRRVTVELDVGHAL